MSNDDKPLEGRRVVVTRSAEQAGELAARLAALGARVLLLPLVEFAPVDDPAPLDRSLLEIENFDWLLLTSQNAVRFFAERGRAIEVDLASALSVTSSKPQVAAVGRMTQLAAIGQGWRVDHISSGRGGLEMVEEIGHLLRGKRILLPRSDRATQELPRTLVEAGAHPVQVVAYRTLAPLAVDPAIAREIETGHVEVVTFASPSAFHSLEERLDPAAFRQLIGKARLAAIGPTTAAAIRAAGCEVAIEAKVPTAAGLVAAIAAHYSSHSVSPGRSK